MTEETTEDTTEFDSIKTSMRIDAALHAGLEDAASLGDYREFRRVQAAFIHHTLLDFLENPCCDNRDFEHLIGTFAATCMTIGFLGGRRLADMQFPGVENGEIAGPSDSEVQKVIEDAAEVRAQTQAEQNRILSALGIEGAQWVNGVLVLPEGTSPETLLEKARQNLPDAKVDIVSLGRQEEAPKNTGMYL